MNNVWLISIHISGEKSPSSRRRRGMRGHVVRLGEFPDDGRDFELTDDLMDRVSEILSSEFAMVRRAVIVVQPATFLKRRFSRVIFQFDADDPRRRTYEIASEVQS